MQQSFAYAQTYLKTTLACIGVSFGIATNSPAILVYHKKRMALTILFSVYELNKKCNHFLLFNYEPKLSYMIFSSGTPRLSNMLTTDEVIIGGPHR